MPEGHEQIRAGKPAPPAPAQPKPWSAALSAEDLIVLNEEIAGMARAGLPLDQGLAVLAREMGRGRLQRVTADLATDLQQGRTLPEALDRQSGRVPPFYGALVTAGVRSGRIGEVLATLTTYARSMADLRATVLGAFFYPAVVLGVALVLLCSLLFLLVPMFEKIYLDFRMKLPWLTEKVIALSHHPLLVVIAVAVVASIVVVPWLILRANAQGRVAWAKWLYMLPMIGQMIRSARLAAFTDLLGILVDHEVPLPEAFGLAGKACSDPVMAAAAQSVSQGIGHGKPLGKVLSDEKLMPELVTWMVGLGEARGNLGASLHQVAAMYRRQVEMRAAFLRTVLPPLLVIIAAILILVLFYGALFMPILSLVQGLSGH